MASITNQWLKGSVSRDRGHSPVTVALRVESEPNDLRRNAGFKHRLILEQPNGSHHIVTLKHDELRLLLECALSASTEAEKQELRALVASPSRTTEN